MQYFRKISLADDIPDTFYAVWDDNNYGVKIVQVLHYTSGFCEVKRFGRSKFNTGHRRLACTQQQFQLAYVKAMQFIHKEVLDNING